jgi:acyl carrier protein
MNPPPSERDILDALTGIIIEALRVSPDRIKVTARLFADLGAESIDLLDIRFRLEHAFGLKIEQEEIVRSLGDGLEAAEVRERLTVGALAQFVSRRLSVDTRTA